MKKVSLMVLALGFLVGVAHADSTTVLIDYQGYSWETGAFPPSNVGDLLNMVALVDNIDPIFGVNIFTDELSVYANNLVSTGQVNFGGGFFGISYTGGNLELWQDPTPDADFGTNPPNATVPSTFTNGTLFLSGLFQSFFMFFDTNFGVGSYEGFVTFNGGTALGTVNGLQVDGFTYGGTLDSAASVGHVPAGYDLQVDGVIEALIVVAVQEKSWSRIKGLYR